MKLKNKLFKKFARVKKKIKRMRIKSNRKKQTGGG
jgi:hypothetical protein